MGQDKRVMGFFAYPGDELVGASSISFDEVYFLFDHYKEFGTRVQPSMNVVVVIDSPRSRKPFPWRCGALFQEAVEKRLVNNFVVYSPSYAEPEEFRKQVAMATQRLWSKSSYSFEVIDYTVASVQLKASRVEIKGLQDKERRERAEKKYGTMKLPFRTFEEFRPRARESEESEVRVEKGVVAYDGNKMPERVA